MSARQSRGAVVAMLLGYFVVMLDTSIVNLALPSIGADFDSAISELQWTVDAYTVVFSALLVTAGAVCDRLGPRLVYLAGLAAFTLCSIGCALASSGAMLVGARALQGLGAAAIVPGSLALISLAYPARGVRARAIGLWAAAGGTAAATGPLLGGLLLATVGWRAVFWVNLPVAGAAFALTLRGIPAAPPTPTAGRMRVGAQMVAVARAGLAGPVAVGLALNLSFFGQLFVLSLFFQQELGYPAWLAGLALTPQACSAVLAAPLGGRAAARIGPFATMLLGLTAATIGFAGLAFVSGKTPYLAVAVLTFIVGFGMAFAVPAATVAALTAVPRSLTGMAGGVVNAARQMGSAFGVAALGALVAVPAGFLAGFHLAVITAAMVYVAAGVLVILLMVRPQRSVGARSGAVAAPERSR